MKKCLVILLSIYTMLCFATALAAEPVAFLADVEGKITIVHEGENVNLVITCCAVWENDIVVTKENTKAKIIYANAIYEITSSAQYRILKTAACHISDGKDLPLQPLPMGYQKNTGDINSSPIMLLPKELIPAIIPDITRNPTSLSIYSPKNAMFSDNPRICYETKKAMAHELTLFRNGIAVGTTLSGTRSAILSLTDFGAGKMEPGILYTIQCKINGKVVNAPEESTFYLLDAEERLHLEEALKTLKKYSDETTRRFILANILAKHNCFAEAKCQTRMLILQEPNNILYRNLDKLVSRNLGCPEEP